MLLMRYSVAPALVCLLQDAAGNSQQKDNSDHCHSCPSHEHNRHDATKHHDDDFDSSCSSGDAMSCLNRTCSPKWYVCLCVCVCVCVRVRVSLCVCVCHVCLYM